jgi:hypothetical protein
VSSAIGTLDQLEWRAAVGLVGLGGAQELQELMASAKLCRKEAMLGISEQVVHPSAATPGPSLAYLAFEYQHAFSCFLS